MGEMILSYETLFELLRLERSRTELQSLPKTYDQDLEVLLSQEKSLLQTLSEPDRSKKEVYLKNMEKIAQEIAERREKKIVNLALDKSKSSSVFIDDAHFLPKEQKLFENMLSLLTRHRSKAPQEEKKPTEEKKVEPKPAEKKEEPSQDISKKAMVRFLQALPSFVTPSLKTLGPFEAEEIALLPKDIASLLENQKRAKIIQYN